MIVYGDPSFSAPLDELIGGLLLRLEATCVHDGRCDSLDPLRGLLIEAGQVEQAAEDAPDVPLPLLAAIRTTTDELAAAFHQVYSGRAGGRPNIQRAIAVLRDAPAAQRIVRVKVPEGFAFYSLFPEQYCAAAARWAAENALSSTASVAVVGVRSIGTTLSAVVRAALEAGGCRAHRLTVRPTGHPFDRRVAVDPADLRGATHAIIVDEGPGASGSSMAAAARAAVEAGIDPARVCFFPGHAGEPGGSASPDVRDWWRTTRRIVVPADELRWNGRSLRERLAEESSRLLDGARVDRMDDVGGGLWRRAAFDRAGIPVPPAFPAFERSKYRCVAEDGRAVVWKFAGWGAAADRLTRDLDARAAKGWTPAPIGAALGFIAMPWVDGQPLAQGDGSPEMLGLIGRYIAAAAGPALAPAEQQAGFDRLGELLYWNAWESLGQPASDAARALCDAAAPLLSHQPMAAYGDGRLGPYEWIRTPAGRIVKVDCAGHDADHTVVGKQPLAWDVAGAIVEWDLNETRAAPVLAGAAMTDVCAELITFYTAAYAAFRVGMASMCHVDAHFYLSQLRQILR